MKMEPRLYVIYHHLGLALAAKDRLQEAVEQYHIALRINPNRPDIHEDLGRAYAKAGFNDAAIREFEIVLALRPSASRFNLLGVAYARKGEIDKAIENFKMAIYLDASRTDYGRNLAAALEMMNASEQKKDYQGSSPFEYEPKFLTNAELFSFAW
jgi:tetratricopeptide (TPR) repeat protein